MRAKQSAHTVGSVSQTGAPQSTQVPDAKKQNMFNSVIMSPDLNDLGEKSLNEAQKQKIDQTVQDIMHRRTKVRVKSQVTEGS